MFLLLMLMLFMLILMLFGFHVNDVVLDVTAFYVVVNKVNVHGFVFKLM